MKKILCEVTGAKSIKELRKSLDEEREANRIDIKGKQIVIEGQREQWKKDTNRINELESQVLALREALDEGVCPGCWAEGSNGCDKNDSECFSNIQKVALSSTSKRAKAIEGRIKAEGIRWSAKEAGKEREMFLTNKDITAGALDGDWPVLKVRKQMRNEIVKALEAEATRIQEGGE